MDIEDLYSMLPDFQCKPGCTECCTQFGVPCRSPVEDERIKRYLKEHGMELGAAEGNTCPYVDERGCTIYPVRPFICRLYGTSPNYPCVVGVRPIEPLHPDVEEEIFHIYRTRFF